ncbi:MICA2 monooxygenase, partial [Polypterus senegalus]
MERGAYGHRYANCRAPATTRSARLPPCRHFLNGSCPFGQNCRHSHELPAWKSSQVCRYFQRGGCWFGDRCRYEHVLQTDGSFLDSRRRSAPVIHPVLSGEAAETRRGSEPSIQQVHGTYAGSRRVSEPAVASLQRNFERLSTEYEEPTVAEFVPRIQQPKLEILSARSTLQVQNGTSQCHTRAKSTSAHVPYNPVGNITEENEDLNGLHASKQGENVDTAGSQCRTQNVGVTAAEAYERSKDVTCGICMDKVYEKPAPDDRCFGILPNCNHAFCLSCIVTWRKTKDFQAEVIKSCPQCRVKSTYYIPYKYWVSDPVQKQNLISNFKERSGKPLICQLPLVFKRNLLALIQMIRTIFPEDCLHDLICAIQKDNISDSWVHAILEAIKWDLEMASSMTTTMTAVGLRALTENGQHRVAKICERIMEGKKSNGRWMNMFHERLSSPFTLDVQHQENQKKRKSNSVCMSQGRATDSEEEGSQMKKQKLYHSFVKLDDSKHEEVHMAEMLVSEAQDDFLQVTEYSVSSIVNDARPNEAVQTAGDDHLRQSTPRPPSLASGSCEDLPDRIQKLDLISPEDLRIFNECNPVQLGLLCKALGLSDVPEQVLPQFCSQLLAIATDLSYSSATVLVRNLFLNKVEPSSSLLDQIINKFGQEASGFSKSMKFAKMLLTFLTKYHSKVSRDTLYEATREVLQGSRKKRRKLKTTPRPKFSVCVLGDQQHCDEAKAAEVPHMDIEALKKLNKNKKLVKKLAKKFDAFLASESLIKQIPRILGPGLNKAGKFPSLLTHNENMMSKVDEVKSTIKFQMKKVLCLAVAVGHVKMSEDELVYNIHLAINFLVSLLKKNWQNVAEQKTCEVTDHLEDSEESDEAILCLCIRPHPVQTAFAQLSLAFKCDQYTLKKRLQVEERARDVAEENIKRELEAGCTILKTLKSMCPDKKRLEVLQQLELSLQILSNAIGRITCTAELLGAVHQEARMSRAVELMVVHVENLKRRHAKEHSELEETKRLVQRNIHSRKLSDSRDESETRQKLQRPSLQQSQNSEAKIVDSGKIKDDLESLEVTKDGSQDCSRFPLHSSTKESHASCSQMPLILSLSPSQQVDSSDSQDEDDDKCVNRDIEVRCHRNLMGVPGLSEHSEAEPVLTVISCAATWWIPPDLRKTSRDVYSLFFWEKSQIAYVLLNLSQHQENECHAYFDEFIQAQCLKDVQEAFSQLCHKLELDPRDYKCFYKKLKGKLNYWKAKAIWVKLDKRAAHQEYKDGKACAKNRCLVLGAGPCGLRVAIELALLGAKVVLIEKRDAFSRHNVLHLWPYTIHDLRNLSAKKFYGKFCSGSLDHISIRQLQLILVKVALILGVEIHTGVEYKDLLEPCKEKQNSSGFRRKEMRGKLAIGITANFINRHTAAEAKVSEISGVAKIYNQKFFQNLHKETGIDLENIVYYKDDTHYFVMTAKKKSLLNKGVIKKNQSDTDALLSTANVNFDALKVFAYEAAQFSTNHQLPDLEFALNSAKKPDVAVFDFTCMYRAENASLVKEKNGHRLLIGLVGDCLVEVSHLYVVEDHRKVKNKITNIPKDSTNGYEELLKWCQQHTTGYKNVKVTDFTNSWKSGLALCALIHHFKPKLIDFDSLDVGDAARNNQTAFDIAEQELGITPIMSGNDMASQNNPDKLAMVMYLTHFFQIFQETESPTEMMGPLSPSKSASLSSTKSALLFLSKLKHNTLQKQKSTFGVDNVGSVQSKDLELFNSEADDLKIDIGETSKTNEETESGTNTQDSSEVQYASHNKCPVPASRTIFIKPTPPFDSNLGGLDVLDNGIYKDGLDLGASSWESITIPVPKPRKNVPIATADHLSAVIKEKEHSKHISDTDVLDGNVQEIGDNEESPKFPFGNIISTPRTSEISVNQSESCPKPSLKKLILSDCEKSQLNRLSFDSDSETNNVCEEQQKVKVDNNQSNSAISLLKPEGPTECTFSYNGEICNVREQTRRQSFRRKEEQVKSLPSAPIPAHQKSKFSPWTLSSPRLERGNRVQEMKPSKMDPVMKTEESMTESPYSSEKEEEDEDEDDENEDEFLMFYKVDLFDEKFQTIPTDPKEAKKLETLKMKTLERRAKMCEMQRFHKAQSIQRRLEEIEVKFKELESKGVILERELRKEAGSDMSSDRIDKWIQLVHKKNELMSEESELMVASRQLELEDKQSMLEKELRVYLEMDDSVKTMEDRREEERVLAEMLDVVDMRNSLVTFLEEKRLKDISDQLHGLPVMEPKKHGGNAQVQWA